MADMRSALQNALDELGVDDSTPDADTEDTASAEVTDESVATPDAQGAEDETPDDDSSETPAETESAAADEGTADEPPLEYFGQDLSGLPAEERASIIAQFQERDRHIQQLLREKAEAAKEGDKPADVPAADEGDVTDADILAALGMDADREDSEAKAIVAMARMNLTLQNEVKAMASKDEVRETERIWETTLDSLEKQYGALPVDRMEVFKTAVENGIADPMSAYWRVMGPARQGVMEEVRKRREAATKALAKTQPAVKPKAKPPVKDPEITGTDVRQSTTDVLKALVAERGMTFSDDD